MAGPENRIARELDAAVWEYLKLNGHEKTLAAFEDELLSEDTPIRVDLTPNVEKKEKKNTKDALLDCFENGHGEQFFSLWDEHLSEDVLRHSSDCQKLEFKLHIYFAIYPILHEEETTPHGSLQRSMQGLKHYLETEGASLSQVEDLVVYYALPYVATPKEHPIFKLLFKESWQNDLEHELRDHLDSLSTSDSHQTSYIYQLHTGAVANKGKEIESYMSQVLELQRQLREYEYRTTVYFRKHGKIQADYHTLIGIAAELVDALENAVKGEMVTSDYLQNICERLLVNSKAHSSTKNIPGGVLHSYDASRPVTAGSIVRSSLMESIPQMQDFSNVSHLPSLNYDKVKRGMLHLPDHNKALLLQALRWRLTRSMPGEQRDAVIAVFISNDILGCALDFSFKEELVQVIRTSEKISCEQFSRLFNALSSFSAGRAYISKSSDLMSVLIAMTKHDSTTSSTSEHLLGALQKLSLRRSSQTLMIRQDMVPWLLDCLSNSESLSDYSTEYAVALLMNLCLRSSGKILCLSNPGKVIKLLTDLLACDNHDIRPYVNGTLYSILALPTVRGEAVEMGLEEILTGFIDKDQPDMNRQIQFIIKQLNADPSGATDNPQSGDEADDDDDDEDEEGDAVDVDLDKETSLSLRPDELHGEKLLCKNYLGALHALSTTANVASERRKPSEEERLGDNLFRRPMTPSGVRLGQSRSAPFSRNEQVHDAKRHSSASPIKQHYEEQSARASLTSSSSSRPSTQSGRRDNSLPTIKTLPGQQKPNANAFTARPKIPRTPDYSGGQLSRPSTSEPPLPTRSISPPRR